MPAFLPAGLGDPHAAIRVADLSGQSLPERQNAISIGASNTSEIFLSRYHGPTKAVESQTSETTKLLLAWADGDGHALEALTPRVYRELRRMAAAFMKGEREGQTLQATALVHEVYLRLIDVHNVPRHGKAHFFAMCAQIMRRWVRPRALVARRESVTPR